MCVVACAEGGRRSDVPVTSVKCLCDPGDGFSSNFIIFFEAQTALLFAKIQKTKEKKQKKI